MSYHFTKQSTFYLNRIDLGLWPFQNISLIPARSFKLGVPRENHLTFRKQSWSFALVNRPSLELTAVRLKGKRVSELSWIFFTRKFTVYRVDKVCNFLLTFLFVKIPSVKGLLLQERICCLFRIDPF